MTGPEIPKNSGDFSQENPKAVFLRKEFGLVKADPQRDRGLSSLSYISEFDGWAIEKDSFLDKWLEFAPVKRLAGVHQLGLNRHFPLPNNHTRFDHSAEVALRTTLVLSRLARDFREEFLVLSCDYPLSLNPQLSGKEKEDEQIFKTIKLGAIYAVNHDIATPAGGDAVKYIVGLDDDRDLPMVLNWHREDFAALCQEDRLNPKEVTKLFVKIAQRKEKGILGQLIHRSGGEDRGFDLDSICYTLMDAQACLGLSWMKLDSVTKQTSAVEKVPLGLGKTAAYLVRQQDESNQRAQERVRVHEGELKEHYKYDLPLSYINFSSLRPQRPPQFLSLGDFSLFDSLSLQDGKVVFTDSRKIYNLFLLADFLARYIYFSPASLGPEVGLGTSIELNHEGVTFSETEKRYLLTASDHSFLENLKKNFPNWAYWFSDLACLGWRGSDNLSRSKNRHLSFIDNVQSVKEIRAFLENLFTIRQLPSRLATPLLASGKIKTLGEIFPQNRERIKRTRRINGYLADTFPHWVRPPSPWYLEDEFVRPDRYRLERRSI